VPLNFRLAPAEWDAVAADCAPKLLVHDRAWGEAARALALRGGMTACAVEELTAVALAREAPGAATPGSPVLLVYTSGTTGKPKGAVHTQSNLVHNMRMASAAQAITPRDVVATVLPLFHVGGLCIQTLPALYAGATVILHSRFDAGATLECFARDRPTLTLQVPATMKALVEHPGWAGTDLSSLRAMWAGSSILPEALVQAFHARGLPVCNVYGATETGPFSIALGPQEAMSHAGTCGWPVEGVEARLADEKAGVGEVLVRAGNVVQRYWPEVPAVDAEGWFHTGDLASRAADGSYTIVGRAKDMIISGGENIYPAELENLLATHPGVAECAVIGMPDAKWGEVVVAVIVPAAGVQAGDDELLSFLAQRIARYKLPRKWARMEVLPRTALGKVQKQVLAGLLG
jgi:fatty-acyl-CoA synthase